MKTLQKYWPAGLGLAAFLLSAAAFGADGAVADKFKWMTFAVFGAIIAVTMYVTYVAARQTHTTSEF